MPDFRESVIFELCGILKDVREKGMRIGLKVVVALFIVAFVSCAVMPKELREEGVEREITLKMVKEDLEIYRGSKVMWGGRIIRCENKRERTFFEVLQLPLDVEGRPKDVDESEGRFLVLYDGFLDCAIYCPGREITVIGEVRDLQKGKLGEMEYVYPVVRVKRIHLWKKRKEEIDVYHYHYWPPPFPWWCHPRW